MTCTCGHVEDEHDRSRGGCEIEGCECVYFDWDGEDDE